MEDGALTIISLLVATVGGIPGLFQVYSSITKRPNFRLQLQSTMFGNTTITPPGKVLTHMLATVTIGNEGPVPLTPASFSLYILKGRKWIPMRSTIIPENIKFESDVQNISIGNPSARDILKYPGSIQPNMPLRGFLFFTTDQFSLEEITKLLPVKFKFVCTDIFNKNYSCIIEQKNRMIPDVMVQPKHGVQVSKKNVENE